MTDKNKDHSKKEDNDKTKNQSDKAPNINQVAGQQVTDEKASAGKIGGIKPSEIKPKSGGRQGGTSVEDGGQDMGSSAGSR